MCNSFFGQITVYLCSILVTNYTFASNGELHKTSSIRCMGIIFPLPWQTTVKLINVNTEVHCYLLSLHEGRRTAWAMGDRP